MARILAYTSPARGHLFPTMAILEQLRERGHEVVVRTLASEVESVRSRGMDAEPIDAAIEELAHDDWRARTPQGGLKRSVAVFARRARVDGPDMRRALEETRPDAAMLDINCWGAMAEAERWDGPWAAVCPYPLPLPSRDVPPFGPGLPPAQGPLGRLRDRALRPLLHGAVERTMLPPVNELRAATGLPALARSDDLFTRPPLLLYLTAEPFEYPRSDWPPNVLMVGPCGWDPPQESPAWLESLQRPLVLVTSSSEFQDDGRLVQAALDGLAGEAVDVVATVPSGEPGRFRVPANARLERFVPHGFVLPRAVCAVTHGGMGATQKALDLGTPVCVVPFGRDQLEVARRVEVSGAGARLPLRRLSPGRLRDKVMEARSRVAGAQRVAAGFARAGGASAAAEAIERRLLG